MSVINVAAELIELEAGINYAPTKISTDKRNKSSNAIGYYQIGEADQYGNANGPIFRMSFVDLSSVTATHIQLFGIKNEGTDGVEIPVSYFSNVPVWDIYLQKFEFTDGSGSVQTESDYQIIGHKLKQLPYSAI